MKVSTVLGVAILILLPGTIVPSQAQEHEQEKQPDQRQQQSQPAQHAAKPAKQAQHQQPAKPSPRKQQRAASQPEARPAQQPQRRQEAQRASRSQPAAGHGPIPEDRFRASFGRGHTFHVNRSEFANGSRRFQYGGYWFTAVDPWPVGWLYTDNVYVDYLNGGYFLCNPVHPGVYISVNIG